MKTDPDPTTYFGLYSSEQIKGVTDLLRSLNVNFYSLIVEESEERLKAWGAWNSALANPTEGHELFIYDVDLEKVGTRLVELNRISGNENNGLPAPNKAE